MEIKLSVLAANAVIHAIAIWAMEHTHYGRCFKIYIQEWRCETVWELISYSMIVFIWGVAAVLSVGLLLQGVTF